MNPERWQQIKDLFVAAAGRGTGERSEFLAQACGDDVDLRQEVEALLESDEAASTLLATPVAAFLSDLPRQPRVDGRRFGAYRVVGELGRGGMAAVYAAVRDDDQYSQQVAVKLIKRGMDTEAIVARFRRERQILANLEHPNIARLLDGGVSDDGLPYLVMEQIDGVPIDVYCAEAELPIEERLRLFRTVCAAVQSAHQNLVVHRDLKPSNILVTRDGVPKLLDFGIAKLIGDDDLMDPQMATEAGIRPMTPGYASPEQVRGGPITTASDVYALGVLLYLMLSGRRPYQLETLTPREVELAVCEQEPAKPSAVVGPGGKPRHQLTGDLDTIVLTAMHKEPERRYGSVEQLSEDLRRHLEGLPVLARADTFAYRGGKFLGRHRFGVTAALLVFLSLVAGIVATAWQARVARDALVTAEEVSDFLVDLFDSARPDRTLGEKITASELLDRGAERIDRNLAGQPKVRARLLDHIGSAYTKLGLFDEAEQHLEKALDLRIRTLGEDHLEVAVSRTHLGELYKGLARYKEAENEHREALALRLRNGAGAALVAESENHLGVALYHQGLELEAEPWILKALENARRAYGEDHAKVANVLNNLALVLYRTGRPQEAEARARQALAMHRRLHAIDSPDVAPVLNNLAEILRAQGDCEEAVAFYQETLALEIRLLGDRHPDLASTHNNLAGCLKDVGRFDEAEEHYRHSLALRREAFGDEHVKVAESLNNLGVLFYKKGELTTAVRQYREALALYRRIHPNGHSDIPRTLKTLGAILANTREYSAAAVAYREALALNRELAGDESLEVAISRQLLADVLFFDRQLEEAGRQLELALALKRSLPGSKDESLAGTLYRLGRVLAAAGEPERAEPFLREGLELWRQWPEKRWRELARTRLLFGGCLVELGRPAEAEPYLVESYEIFARRAPVGDRDIVESLRQVVEVYEALNRPDEAGRYRAELPD